MLIYALSGLCHESMDRPVWVILSGFMFPLEWRFFRKGREYFTEIFGWCLGVGLLAGQ